ncbi:MAG TPA: response regulator, partial [Blastocatellia bacterium]|nr:response regulator [Blastocatellia bacterium]
PLISNPESWADSANTDGAGRDDASPDCPPTLKGLRLFIVDDEPDTLEMLTVALEQCEARVTAALSVEKALEALDLLRPDVLISDIGMPGEDGYALIKKVRALEQERGWPTIPCVALTAFAGKEDRMRSLSAGFQMHLPKPIDVDELIAVIENLSDRGRPRAPSL